MTDYSYPTMMAERSLKDLHNAMLENRYEDAVMACLNVIVEVRLALASIKDMQRVEEERRQAIAAFSSV
jgi:hypothetical protein